LPKVSCVLRLQSWPALPPSARPSFCRIYLCIPSATYYCPIAFISLVTPRCPGRPTPSIPTPQRPTPMLPQRKGSTAALAFPKPRIALEMSPAYLHYPRIARSAVTSGSGTRTALWASRQERLATAGRTHRLPRCRVCSRWANSSMTSVRLSGSGVWLLARGESCVSGSWDQRQGYADEGT